MIPALLLAVLAAGPAQAGSVLESQRQLKLRPDSPRAWYELGRSYASQGAYAKAADAYRLSLAKDPRNGACRCAHALALRELGRPKPGLAEAEACLALLPDYAGAFNLKGNFLHDLGRFNEALDSYQKAVDLSPAYANAHFNLGIAALELGMESRAQDAFSRALQLDGRLVEAWDSLGNLRLRQGKAPEARDCFARALAIRPSDPEAHWGMARVLRRLGLMEQALNEERSYVAAMRAADAASRPKDEPEIAGEAWKSRHGDANP